jgi:8-oxo-dGTP diphosphatase
LLKGSPHKRVWPNRYNGVGGHVEQGENVLAAALREIREETGLSMGHLDLCGVLNVDVGQADLGIMVFVFWGQVYDRQVRPSGEGSLEWIPINDLLEYELVKDVPILLSRVLAMRDSESRQQPFFARSYYEEGERLCVEFAELEL